MQRYGVRRLIIGRNFLHIGIKLTKTGLTRVIFAGILVDIYRTCYIYIRNAGSSPDKYTTSEKERGRLPSWRQRQNDNWDKDRLQ